MVLGLLGLATVASPRTASAQVIRAFTQRFPTTNTTGSIVLIGNTLSTCDTAVAGCIAGQSGAGGLVNDNDFTNVDIDVDADATTFNSSNAVLTLAPGDSVLFAGLYWGARSASAARNTVRFRTPATAGYSTLTATQLDVDAATNTRYQGFIDVTTQVRAGGSGTYFVANVQRQINANRYAGWGLVVVLYNPGSLARSLVVFDGFAEVQNGAPVSIAVSGLNTPPAGPVSTQLGVIAYEGDLGLTGDSLLLNTTNVNDALNPAANGFNSSITSLGARFAAKNPDFVNQLGFDVDLLDASNILPNGATTATINLTSSSDLYNPGVVAFATQLFSPNLSGPGSLEKTVVDVNGGSTLAGDTLEYTINMTNTGLDTAVSVVLIDTIPADASYAAGSLTFITSVAGGPTAGANTDAAGDDAANFDAAGNRVLFQIGAGATAAAGGKLGPTQTTVVRFRIVIGPATASGAVIANQAAVSYAGQSLGTSLSGVSDGDPGTAGSQPTNVTVTAPDLGVTKSHTGDFTAGVPASYTLTVTNSGTAATIGTLTLLDSLPAGLTPTGASGGNWTCGISAQVVTCTHSGPLAVSGTSTVTVNVSVLASAVPSVTNIARVSTPGDANTANDRVTDVTTVGAGVDLSVTNTDSVAAVNPGGSLKYTIVATNAGPSAVTTALVTDTFDLTAFNVAGITWSCTATAGSSCPASGNGDLNAAVNLLIGGSATFTIAAPVLASATGTITNTATIAVPAGTTELAPADNSAIDNNTVLSNSADLGLTKTAAPDPVNSGGTITYTLTATNNGPLAAQAVTIQDTTPASTTFLSATPGAGGSCATPTVGGTGLIDCSWTGATASGAPNARSVTLVVTVGSGTADSTIISNTATASSATPDSVAANNSATTQTAVATSADLAITSAGPATVTPGQTIALTIKVTNNGPSDATGVSVDHPTPAGLTFVSTAGACATTFPCALGVVPAGANRAITATYQVPPGYAGAGPIVFTATATAPTADPTPGNNTATVSTALSATSADLGVTKTGPASVTLGTNAVYTVTVTNAGPSDAAGVSLSDPTPPGLTLVSASAPCASGFPCALDTVTAGASITITVTYLAPLGYAGADPVVNTATVTATTADPIAANDSASASTAITQPSADLSVIKTGPASAVPGTSISYSLTVANAGPNDATGVSLDDPTPAGLSLASASAPCSGGFPCALGTMVTGASVVVTVTYSVPPDYAGPSPLLNTATVSAVTADPVAANNSQSASAAVTPMADLGITKTDGLVTVTSGNVVTYTIVVTNAGPSSVTGANVDDPVPAQLAGVTWTCAAAAGSCAFGAGTGSVATTVDLSVGGTATFSVSGTVTQTSGALTNTATVTAPAGLVDPVATNNGATDITTVSAIDVQVNKTHAGVFTMGSTGSYTITVTNVGTAATTGTLTVLDSLPAGLTFSTASGAGWDCAAAGQAVSCTNPGPIAAGAASSLALTVSVQSAAAATVTNVARVQAAGDVNAANDRTIDPTAITAVDLALAKRHSGVFAINQTGVYTLAVTNQGTAATIGAITLTDTLPLGLGFVAGAGAGWTCSAAATVVTCANAGPLAAGDSSLVTLTVSVGFAAVPEVTNGAVVTTPGDTSSADNRALDSPTIVVGVSSLAVEKEASRAEVEIGDQLEYTIRVRNRGVSLAPDVTVDDRLPAGFSYVTGTTRRDGVPVADPTGGHGPQLVFTLDTLAPASQTTLTYRVRVLPGAGTGDGVNRALARSPFGPAQSNEAAVRVRLIGGVFTDEGLILGKVYVENSGAGVPGVRIYMEDGTSTVTDLEGKYSFSGVTPRLHIVKVDGTTVPEGSSLVLVSNRQAGNAASHFVDVQRGELHRADFALAGVFAVTPTDARPDTMQGAVGLRPTELPSTGAFAAGEAEYTRDSSGEVYTGVLPARTLTNDNSNAPALPDAELVPTLAIGRRGVVSVQVPLGAVPADGQTIVPVAIRLLDGQGAPLTDRTVVTLEAGAGRWQVDDEDAVAPGVQTTVTGGARNLSLVAAGQAGQAQLRVSANGLSGSATLAFVPAHRPLLAAGVVEGRVDLRSWSLPADRVRDRFEDELRALSLKSANDRIHAGTRAAVFVKGTIGPEFVIDLRLDTERDPRARLFRDIRPEEFYPVYGDASVKEFDAQSTSRLYLRVEKARSYFLFGDYGTLPATEVRMLGAYARSLNGALQHFENRRSQANLFASRGHESQVIDEFPARGTSGPFVLSQKSGLTNSERVEIVTRDRNQPAVVLKAERLTRFADYTIEPFTGRLLLKLPVPSVDQNLNPISIRVSYEVDQGGTPFWTFGADAQVRATDRIELGGSAVHDDNPLGARSLVSANTTIRFGERTYALMEVAHADSASAASGDAFRFELRHFAERWEARLYGLDAGAGFANPSSALGRGRRELGLRGSGLLDRRTRVLAEALRSEDLVTHARRIGIDVGVEREITSRLRAELGVRHAELNTNASETNSIHFRLTGQVARRAAVFGEYEQALSPGDAHRALIGGDYRIAQRARVYARHELISSLTGPYDLNGSQRRNTTVIGIDADYLRNGSVFTEYRARDVISGREAEAAIGLRNRWTLAPGLKLNTSLERISPLAGAGSGEATAITGAIEYADGPRWRGSARLEYRTAPAGDNWLASLGYGRKLSRDWTALGRSVLSALPSDELHERTQIGLAFRQTDQNRWNLLARYEHKYDRAGSPTGAGIRDGAHVFSSHVNYQPMPAWTFSGELALKLASEWAPGGTVHTHAELLDIRAVRDLNAQWDIGASSRALVTLGEGRSQYGIGVEVGRTLHANLRVALGYNLFGFRDRDLVGENYTDQGVYMRFGLKFDEGLLGLLRPGRAPAP